MTWQQELREALKTPQDLKNFFGLSFDDTPYPILLPKKFAQSIKDSGKNSPLWKQFLPSHEENLPGGFHDPIGDEKYSKPGQLIHRYESRALFLPTQNCPIICRYCFRKNELMDSKSIFDPKFDETINYLGEHPEIEEIIFSGGDPLVLSDQKIKFYLKSFAKIPSIKYIRFHSRTPIVLPSRITENFIELINELSLDFDIFHLAIHINHPDEITQENRKALEKLRDSKVQLLSQSVLLKNVNDQTCILKELFLSLSELEIRPYYLHHPDQVKGGSHFMMSLPEGRRIYAQLRNILPSWATPQYIIDIPGGEGKVPAFNPEKFDYSGKLINRDARLVSCPL